jgi:crotonobetainyl-CoA:carnitine CoA-transferase CaiB-like acyl-CoA transferase
MPFASDSRAMTATTSRPLPLDGLRVLDMSHMILGPSMGMILGDLGAEVIKIEPVTGDNTRNLLGSGAGFFALFNRNKKSFAIDTKDPRGREILLRLVATADVFNENFKPGAMAKLGLDYASLKAINPRLIYVSHKGFLPGPYEHRTALDEVVQMMGGLAYMTGPEGRPLRAGSSINDIMGGMFGVIGVLCALIERDHPAHGTGQGKEVRTALFENNILLVAQHMLQASITGKPAAPMPSRISAWGIYDVFTVAGGEMIFLGVVSDTQWGTFCREFGFDDLAADPRLARNNQRVEARSWLMPILRERLAGFAAADLGRRFEAVGLPYAPITRPEELFDDPHLRETGGLVPVDIPADANSTGKAVTTEMPLLPIALDGLRMPIRRGPPSLGADTRDLLSELGYGPDDVSALKAAGIVV